MNKMSAVWFGLLLTALTMLSGCVTRPTIDANKFSSPKSVAIVNIPKMNVPAIVGVIVPHAPGFPQFHFSDRADQYFAAGIAKAEPKPDHVGGVTTTAASHLATMSPAPSVGMIGGTMLASGVIGAIIQSSAEETWKKSQNFSAEILKLFPTYDLQADFMTALTSALKQRGVAVTVVDGEQDRAPRLWWPAVDSDGNAYPTSAKDFPAVDTDLLVQVSPIAFYNSPGQLNSYGRNVTVGVAVYDGRTKRFIGRETVSFSGDGAWLSYSQYDGLVADLNNAAPALRSALISLAPKVADLVTGVKPTK